MRWWGYWRGAIKGEVGGFESLIAVGKLPHRQQRGNSLIPLSINSLCLDACGRNEIVADKAREGRESSIS